MDLSSIEDTKKTYGYKPSRCQNCDEYFDPSFLPVHLNNCGPTTIQQENLSPDTAQMLWTKPPVFMK